VTLKKSLKTISIINAFKIYTIFNCVYFKNNFIMNRLELKQMEKFTGGELTGAEACGIAIGIGLVAGPWWFIAAVYVCSTQELN
jgi:hypothetical protein